MAGDIPPRSNCDGKVPDVYGKARIDVRHSNGIVIANSLFHHAWASEDE